MSVRFVLAVLVVLLVFKSDAHKSVKEMRHTDEDDAVKHHMMHRQHRTAEGKVHGDKIPRPLSHHEVELKAHLDKHGNDGRHPRRSIHPDHHVGPRYSDHIKASHKQAPRFNNKGEHIPDEIRDETVRMMRH